MERQEVLRWLETHPALVNGIPETIVSRCESTVRRHAREDAWSTAKRFVSERRTEHKDPIGAHASEVYVAREVCHQVARDLLRHEPHYEPGDEDHLADRSVRASLDERGWTMLIPWILDVARDEEHRTWLEISRYTDRLARNLIREHHLSGETRFDDTKCYGEVAQRIESLLERDYALHITSSQN